MDLKEKIRGVKDFPIPGIMFRDITTLLKDRQALQKAGTILVDFAKDLKVDVVAGIESRGFIFGMYLAEKLGAGFVPVRKPGKLPAATYSHSYQLEYGNDTLEIHQDALFPGAKVLIHDDLLATGGTAEATARLIEKAGGEVVQVSFLIELTFLNGRTKLQDYDVRSIVEYHDEN
ncbi:MAG: adenine phosphoribosyltransferase [Microscillaceae bacterium]|nr:adenine phosphoribosyltransferase [Microscillaceae bacterium]